MLYSDIFHPPTPHATGQGENGKEFWKPSEYP